jgi:RimJ/RimL family protein N-acetyltransferase
LKEPSIVGSDLTVRPLSGRDELDLFRSIPYVLNREIEGDLDAGRRRLEWLWVALRGDRLVGRAGWWTRTPGDRPHVLDLLDLSTVEDGVALVATALEAVLPDGGTPPDHIRFLAPDWHDDPAAVRDVEARTAALGRLGARPLVERLRLQWDAGGPVPPPSDRLRFRPVAGRDELVGMMTAVVDGTLDAHTRSELTTMTPAEQAAFQYEDELERYDTPRSWWRVGTLRDGTPVGFVIPARNAYNPIIAYIGVLPSFRGHGYVDDLLGEGTRVLAAEGVPRIRASTDVGNVPMAKAFARAGYATFERQLDLTWS